VVVGATVGAFVAPVTAGQFVQAAVRPRLVRMAETTLWSVASSERKSV